MKDIKQLLSQPLCNGYTYQYIKLLAECSCQHYEMQLRFKVTYNCTLNYSKQTVLKKKLRYTLHRVKLTLKI